MRAEVFQSQTCEYVVRHLKYSDIVFFLSDEKLFQLVGL